MHFYKNKNGVFCLKGVKPYTWEIPIKLEKENIKWGDIVLVNCKKAKALVVVLNVLEIMEEKTKHKKVIKILEKIKNNIFILKIDFSLKKIEKFHSWYYTELFRFNKKTKAVENSRVEKKKRLKIQNLVTI